ncbi:MAG: polyprenyl synthetase family protein [Deltaproteobacteria bacterium]|nr:MAG: polyprenyl synthetase family protein [Deltaproteobacteria bacterium]
MSQQPHIRLVPDAPPASKPAAPTDRVERLMIRLAAGDKLERCGAMVVEHLTTGGKRIRAKLAIASALSMGASYDDAVPWAAACELLHNASLIHDDLQDGDRMRRDAPTLWVRHGMAQAINAGDLLLMLPTLALDELTCDHGVRWLLSRALSHYAADTVRGQSLEMTLLDSRRFGWDDYVRAVHGKTAGFFALPIYGSALLAGRSEAQATAVADAFATIGTIFQIQDDVIDLYGQKGREAVGADVREGKVSALVVEHMRLYPEEATWLMEVLATPRDETTDEQVDEVIRRFRDGGALEEVLDRIYDLASRVYTSPVLDAEPALRVVAIETLEKVLAGVRRLEPSLPTDTAAK